MGYALFSQKKILLTARLNSVQLQQTQRSDEQFVLATQQTSLKQQLSSLTAAESSELATLYGQLSETSDSTGRDSINAQIKQKEEEFKKEQEKINRQVYEISMREQAFQMEVKRLDTVVTKLEKELEAVEQAEKDGIEGSVPKFNGLG